MDKKTLDFLNITFCNWSFQIINIFIFVIFLFYHKDFKQFKLCFQHILIWKHAFRRFLLYNSDNYPNFYSFQHYQQYFQLLSFKINSRKVWTIMVRGINKRIIEINDTQNPYFERAVLYLKDNQADSSKKALETQAQSFLGNLRTSTPAFLRSGLTSRLWSAGKLLLSAAAGCALTLWFLW